MKIDSNDDVRLHGPEEHARIRTEKTEAVPNVASGNGDISRLKPEDTAELQRLAALSPLAYDRERTAAAKKLRIRTATLDGEVVRRRPMGAGDPKNLNGSALELVEVEAWPEPVDGAEVADEIRDAIREFLVLPPLAAEAATLWIFRSHGHDVFDFNPRLAVLSPEKRCGKTRILMVLSLLCPRPLLVSNMSPAAIFRTVEAGRPTLFIDELDSFQKKDGHEELRGILNSGHHREAAWIIRAVATDDDFEPRKFSTWAPMALAAIGTLPDTLTDRSIVIPMRRKKPGESVTSFRLSGRGGKALRERFQNLARRVARWVQDHSGTLADAEPAMPGGLDDRASDNWFPMVAIADALGGDWPALAREAVITLSGGADANSDTIRTRLLRDIRQIFHAWRVATGMDRLPSQKLCEGLREMEDAPWAEWACGRGLSPHGISKLLGPFGVRSKNLRCENGIFRGYDLADFSESFERYLVPTPENPV